MENKINIVELLKGCPKGMELDCLMYDNVVKLIDVDEREEIVFPIRVVREDGITDLFTKYGQYIDSDFAKCVIYPKGKTTWDGFEPPFRFKDGDILFVSSAYNWIAIYKENENEDKKNLYKYVATADHPNYNCIYYDNNSPLCFTKDVSEIRLATEEEKEKLFKVIKDNGYCWNTETKTLEKLIEPKFKVGDKIKKKGDTRLITINDVRDDYYIIKFLDGFGHCYITDKLSFSNQCDYELVPTKFDISNLKPFDNCKYSLDNGKTWKFAQYWYIQDNYNVNDIEIELWQD